jgi:hypothetical protein
MASPPLTAHLAPPRPRSRLPGITSPLVLDGDAIRAPIVRGASRVASSAAAARAIIDDASSAPCIRAPGGVPPHVTPGGAGVVLTAVAPYRWAEAAFGTSAGVSMCAAFREVAS